MPLLNVDGLTKQFGRFTAVDHVSFTADRGQIFGLLGPNGAGKTTTIRLIATLLTPTSGTAQVDTADIHSTPEKVRSKLGVLTTDIGVYDRFSGRENLEYFAALYGLHPQKRTERIQELAAALEMEDFLDRRAGTYSTGMKQKLAIARSVIHDPDLIFFDEPTAGLDVLAARTVVEFMKQSRAKGKCVVFSTHILHEAQRLCDRVVIMHQAKKIADDSVQNLMHMSGTLDLEDAFLKLVKEHQA